MWFLFFIFYFMKTKTLILTIIWLSLFTLGSSTFANDSCTTYYDGCNTCKIVDGKVACTKMACKATEKPYCVDGVELPGRQPDLPSDSVSAEKVERIPPYYQGGKTYKFDEKAVNALNLKDSSLLKLNCDWAAVLKALGFAGNTKMFSVGLEEGTFDYTFDMRNCSMRGNKRNYVWTNTAVTEKTAIAKAKEFMKSSFFKGKVFDKYGEPIVMYKNSNGGVMPYRMEKSDSKMMSDIEIDPNDTGVLEPEFILFSILFPYVINGKPVYNAYGNKAGITVEVTAEWVTSVNAQLLPFKWAVRSSEKLTNEDIVSFVKRGGNNPYRGNQAEIELQKPERISVLFNVWRNNINEVYLSSGIRFGSKVKLDQFNPNNYEMIISDYKIGNGAYGY